MQFGAYLCNTPYWDSTDIAPDGQIKPEPLYNLFRDVCVNSNYFSINAFSNIQLTTVVINPYQATDGVILDAYKVPVRIVNGTLTATGSRVQ